MLSGIKRTSSDLPQPLLTIEMLKLPPPIWALVYVLTAYPMYLGLVILTLGIAIWVGAWPMFGAPIALFATANWVHIPFE